MSLHLRRAYRAILSAKDLLEFGGGKVKSVVDTANDPKQYDLGKAAYVDEGKVFAWHVTDKPDDVVKAIKKRTNFVQSYGAKGEGAELGPGLYVSAAPGLWVGRQTGKWDFLKTISPEDLKTLAAALQKDVARWSGRYSASEVAMGQRTLNDVLAGQNTPELLASVFASQPFGIQFWKADWLEDADLEHLVSNSKPQAVKVEIRGKYAALTSSHPSAGLLRGLRRAGLSGVFTKGGMAGQPELVVWSGKDIRVVDVEDVE